MHDYMIIMHNMGFVFLEFKNIQNTLGKNEHLK